VQSVRNGKIGFTTVSASNLNQVLPAMDMYSLPFLFKNEAHFWWFLAQPQAVDLAKQMEDKGIKIIGYIDSGSRNFFTQKPVRTPDDLKGQKIRVMASPVRVNTMKVLGATGVPCRMGRALHGAADRRRGRRREQPPFSGCQEVL
jgi:TRAP-type C4-dicarboxylate transport system substrate-binding protein